MTLSLIERRALLRQAVAGSDTNDIAGFIAALGGSTEEERAALVKTLAPTRLLRDEGPTPRACYVLAALGKPALVAETIAPTNIALRDSYAPQRPAMRTSVRAAALERPQEWICAFVDVLAENSWWALELAWPLALDLLRGRKIVHESAAFLGMFVQQSNMATEAAGTKELYGPQIAAWLRAEPGLLEHEFWALFRTEGLGGHYSLTEWNAEGWDAAVRILCDTEAGFRERILNESLAALLRDFSAKNIQWYLRVHRLVDPTPDEIAARGDNYLAVLGSAHSVAVGLAQDMLKRALERIDHAELIAASGVVLQRTEKKLVKAQLQLLRDLVKIDPSSAAAVSEQVSSMLESLSPELAQLALKLVTADAAAPKAAEPVPSGDPVQVPEPRRTPLPGKAAAIVPITDETEFLDQVAAQLEGVGDGAELPRILAYLHEHPQPQLSAALMERARVILESVWNFDGVSPRCHLADTLLSTDGTRRLRFPGFSRFVYLRSGEADPEGAVMRDATMTSSTLDAEGNERVVETHHYRSGYRYISTHCPAALLMEQFGNAPAMQPLAFVARQWQRVTTPPGEGRYGTDRVLGEAAKPFWLAIGEHPTNANASLAERALDVSAVAREFTHRVQQARDQDGYEQIAQWAAWLLADNPDTLAAQLHPELWTATQVVNVRGIGAVLSALGASRQVPGGPTYSALALGLSAKMTEHRAHAAEAVAALAGSGLLDPAPFAAELANHLRDGFALAGRLATSLADAASISAIAGYRVLQMLTALLPDLDGINQAGKLIELAARLAGDYGTPVAVPDAFVARRKGSSVLAVALRTLESVLPQPTPLAEEAAALANAEVTQ